MSCQECSCFYLQPPVFVQLFDTSVFTFGSDEQLVIFKAVSCYQRSCADVFYCGV